jgi:hypothetical protein
MAAITTEAAFTAHSRLQLNSINMIKKTVGAEQTTHHANDSQYGCAYYQRSVHRLLQAPLKAPNHTLFQAANIN